MKKTRICLIVCICLAACQAGPVSPTAIPAATEKPAVVLPVFLSTPAATGQFQPSACLFALPPEVRQGQEVDCGYLSVLEQRPVEGETRQPGDDTHKVGDAPRLIRLAVAIFHPPGGVQHPDPLIYLSGGPGGSTLETLRYGYEELTAPAFAAGRDLIVFDQRGVGRSRPALDCPQLEEYMLDLLERQLDGRPADQAETESLLLSEVSACRAALNQVADLGAYHSAASAADVEDLRLALGYEQVNLWGGSYGTRLALEVMRRYPHGLRSVVLDAVYPPDADLYLEAPANFRRSLERLFAACTANPVCQAAYPDLENFFYATVARLNASPVQRPLENPFTGESYTAPMSGDTLLALTFQALYDSQLRFLLPGYIYAASQDDFTFFDRLRGALFGMQSISSRGMMFSVQCHEELAFSSYADFQAEMERYPELAGMYRNSILGGLAYRICPLWEAGQADSSANQPVSSDLPTLLMSGEFDPVTPPAWGRHAAESLSNGYFFEFPGLGHGAGHLPGCPRRMLLAFWEDPTRAPDASCLADMAAH
ncbi:MAG: alpha/beta fold hydrolase [Chloroflexota bacterium]